jgi:hypothetical protein
MYLLPDMASGNAFHHQNDIPALQRLVGPLDAPLQASRTLSRLPLESCPSHHNTKHIATTFRTF